MAEGSTTAVTVTADTLRPGGAFEPKLAVGATLDGHAAGDTAQIYTPANRKAMLSAGLGAVSVRLRTELGVDAWHWNPKGSWSDAVHHRGYWTSSSNPRDVIRSSYGYRLGRRGSSSDQADNSSYSRLNDGNPSTCWKSNPYLDPHFTHQRESAHAQWVMIDLGALHPIDELNIRWCNPWATTFRLEAWSGSDPTYPLGDVVDPGRWRPFPAGDLHGHPGSQRVRVATGRPVIARYVRVLLQRSAHQNGVSPRGDIRDRLGFSIGEIGVGVRRHNKFTDWVRHAPSPKQSRVFVSSTDPWHEQNALDRGIEEPGYDTVLASKLSRGLPILIPISVLYGTPQDAVAQLRWLKARHIPIRGLELGEEPDGQLTTPADYGALYAQFARALRAIDANVPIGGPSFQTSVPDWHTWPDRAGDHSWMRQFLAELRRQHAMDNFNFFSFEWYPFAETACTDPAPLIQGQAAKLRQIIQSQYESGLPRDIPIYVAELGFSAYSSPAEVDLPGAFFDADSIGTLLNAGATVFFFGYEPDSLFQTQAPGLHCTSGGTLALFHADEHHRITERFAAYWAMNMLTSDWLDPNGGPHRMLPVSVARGAENVRIYSVERPGGHVAFLAINEDRSKAVRLNLRIADASGSHPAPLTDAWEYSSEQYVWHPAGDHGHASPNLPPAHRSVQGNTVTLPAWSMLVIR
ncbi:MAG: hypothetical protein NVSMB57_04230 [Actinomycetota bacterium]